VDAARDVTDAQAAAVLAPGPDGEPMLPRGDAQGTAMRSLLLTPGHRSLHVGMSHAAGGSLYLLRDAGAPPFSAEDAALAQRLVSQAEVSLENANAHQRALAVVGDLDRANAALQAASAARSRFLANVSHELRTPLHAILISAELMADPSTAVRDPDRALKLPSTIGRTGRHLLDLIEDLVDLSRMELHDLRMDLVPMDLGPAIADAIGQVGPLADERGIDLSCSGGEGLRVRVDPKRLRQVLVNLLGNAIKYTPRGGKVRLTATSRWDGLRLSVLDTGIGIDPEDLERAFEPFERVSQLGTTGAGLGLPIARRIMELHGGTLTATSMPGLGSVFTAWVPADAILPAVSQPVPLREGTGATAAPA
jgi:signal transduction histidine kinase